MVKRHRAEKRQLFKYKGNKCAKCGLSVTAMLERYGTVNRMFQFNHIDPTKKHPDYDNLIRRTINTEQLDEIDKCVLLCNECHGVVHAQNLTGEISLTVNVDGHKCEQTFKGQ